MEHRLVCLVVAVADPGAHLLDPEAAGRSGVVDAAMGRDGIYVRRSRDHGCVKRTRRHGVSQLGRNHAAP